jgi:hypothetical protein
MNYVQFIIIPLIYTGLFLIFTFLKTVSKSLDKIIFCTVCAAWFTGLLILIVSGFNVVLVSFAIGMSVTGIAYFLRDFNIKYFNHFLILQLLFTLIGEAVIFMLLKGGQNGF